MVTWLSGFGVSLALVQGLIVVFSFPKRRVAWSYGLLMVAVAAFLLHPLAGIHAQLATQSIRTAIPALFWWLCIEAFTDRPHRFRLLFLLAFFTVLFPAIRLWFFPPHLPPSVEWLFVGIPQMGEYVLILHGLATVALHWREDLVQSRRQLRGWLLGLAGTVIFTQVTLEQWMAAALTGKLALADTALLAVALLILTGRTGVLTGAVKSDPAPIADIPVSPESSDTRALQQAIAEGLYRQEGLTLAKFSRAIRLPEYKTRQLINEQMGFRNFPDFINHYRLADACRRLKENPEEPITVIALDIGFRSVSSFNRVFKEQMKTTPSQYRKSC